MIVIKLISLFYNTFVDIDTYRSINDVNNVTTSQPTRTRIAQPLEQNYCLATNQPVSHLSGMY